MAKKEKKEPAKPSTAWQGTYGDMITLMLCFFVMLYDPSEVDTAALAQIQESLQITTESIEAPVTSGGQSLAAGKLADLGNNISALPSAEKGKSLSIAKKKAVSLFAPEVKSAKITISSDERGVVISLASDVFFEQGSAVLNIDETRDILLKLSKFFQDSELKNRRFRIEGHTDSTPVDNELYPSNWELSSARSANVLHYLSDFGVDEQKFSIAGYADTRPMFSNETKEGQAYNRRVDIIILDEGHF
ncbi:flagellar motor protein MotB [Treponema ruminis]|jgi:chemotaxis protein MotB|uniref:Chemotaxis protein MotB n=1 Tax=Treponema ruminis TaxID=744515 RepID=A0A7W8G8D8_9SPIR|nr:MULTISPECIES: flagellar motor protein MotB [Treponema]MBB5225757.1 chemotaxis protein MotB [Treponema ruminis]MDY6398618.1 flagellar motor protein MotB [Treponema sp.]QSI02447.1 flagellar motor protein MotB [Treponema ruminis]